MASWLVGWFKKFINLKNTYFVNLFRGAKKNGKLFPTWLQDVFQIKLRVIAFCSRPFETSEMILAACLAPARPRVERKQDKFRRF